MEKSECVKYNVYTKEKKIRHFQKKRSGDNKEYISVDTEVSEFTLWILHSYSV